MSKEMISGSAVIAKKIKDRREELDLTVEEAAVRAGVSTKTWCKYEEGESIRKDKARRVCKALVWPCFPEGEDPDDIFSVEEFRDHQAWSGFLEEEFGIGAAMSFAVGSDLLNEIINQELDELTNMPKGSHIGQLDLSWLCAYMPVQFLMNYDYEFLYQMKCTLINIRRHARAGLSMTPHSVMEELLLYLCNEAAILFLEIRPTAEKAWGPEGFEDWVFELLGDMDIISCLYSEQYLDEDHTYHFSHWREMQLGTS